jgi:hypothetical protein
LEAGGYPGIAQGEVELRLRYARAVKLYNGIDQVKTQNMNIYKARADALTMKIAKVMLFFMGLELLGAALSIGFMVRGDRFLSCESLLWAMFLTSQFNGWKNSRLIEVGELLDQADAWDVGVGIRPGEDKKNWEDRLKEAIDKNKK